MMKKEELIEDIKAKLSSGWFNGSIRVVEMPDVVADYIIQRENDLLDDVEKPLKITQDKITGLYFKSYLEEGNVFCKAIGETLSIINSKRGRCSICSIHHPDNMQKDCPMCQSKIKSRAVKI